MAYPLLRRTRDSLMERLGRHELRILASVGAGAATLWGFFTLAEEVSEEETLSLDRALLLAFRAASDPADPLGPGWVEEFGRDITAFGGTGPLILITLAAIIFLILQRKSRAALFVLAAVAGGQLISSLLKFGFERPRPDLVPHGMMVYTSSFPSGHSMMAAVTYLTLGALLARVQPRRVLKAYFLLAAMVITVLVGVSRIYLGVHWPSDVLGGWMAGAAWASLCWTAALVLQRRGQIEQDRAPVGQ